MSKKDEERRNFRISIVSLIVSFIVALIMGGGLGYQIWHDSRSNASADVRFGKIETTIRLLTETVAPQLYKGVSDSLASALSLPGKEAAPKLASAAAIIEQLQTAKTSVPITAVNETGNTLNEMARVHQNLPQTWAVIGDFITYRSQVLDKWQQTSLPLCTEQAEHFQASVTHGSNQVTHGPLELHDCKIILDSPAATFKLSPDLSWSDVLFKRCTVFYNGGTIVLFPVKVTPANPAQLIGNVYFEDCIFVFSLAKVPPPEGQRFIRTLLTATTGTIEFPIG